MDAHKALLTLLNLRRDQREREAAFLNRFESGPDSTAQRTADDARKAPRELGQLVQVRA